MFSNVYRGKRVLVTGHTGFKGSWLAQWLLELGAEVAGYSIDIPTKPSHFEELALAKKIKHVLGDVRDFARLQAAFKDFKPQIVFHLAAQPIVRASYDDPKATFDVNVGGTVNVLEAIRHSPTVEMAQMITTDKVYENLEKDYGYREDDRLGGKDPYSASKAAAEIAFSAYYRSFFAGRALASVRAGNVIGGGDWAADRIVPDCMRAWARKESALVRNPSSTRPWQHVLEPLSGYLWLGAELLNKRPGAAGESFNFGPLDDGSQTVQVLIDEMKKSWPSGAWHRDEQATHKKEAGLLKLSCDKARERLGWQATLAFEETVRMTVQWYRSYYEAKPDVAQLTAQQIREFQDLARSRGRPWAR